MRTAGKKTTTTILMVLLCIATVSSFLGTKLLGKEDDEPGAVLTGVIYDHGSDTDSDGAYNYLEIGVEVNVTVAGYYNIQALGLTSDLGYISVWANPSTFLVIGVQVAYFRFEGVTIYTSGLNPVNISSITLYDENYVMLGEIQDIPLTRVYSYAEFDAPEASLTGTIYDKGVDNDGNGAFDFLDLGVEVNVTEAGDYNVQAYGLSARGFGYIGVATSQSASLEIGTLMIYLRFDGATIYSSDLDPNLVSSISLYGADYEPLGELNDIPLSRTYSYSEFGAAIPVSVGVKAGDWAKYNITGAWQSTDPSATEPSQIEAFREIGWVKFEVQGVSNTYITILQTYHYTNGTEQSAPPMSGDIATQFISVIIPSNLSGGDVIPGTATPLNSTVSRSYAGTDRVVNCLDYSGSLFGMNTTQTMYWDKATGMLCEMFMEISMPTNGYETTTSTSLVMIETNMWKMATELSCSVSKNALTEGDSIVVSGSLSVPLSGKTVTLTYGKPDGSTLNRTVITGSDGGYSDSYTPDATGSWSVTASWEGDSAHGGATSSSRSFAVTPQSFIETPLGMATVGGVITVVAIAAIVLVLRKRKIGSG